MVTGPFINFLLHNHFITENFFKKKSGDVNDEANFSLFILLHKRAKPTGCDARTSTDWLHLRDVVRGLGFRV